ncbi:D-sedoheptulose 7-phosphate isomerase [Planktomarina sp.]|nr:D-sedoheptulose 7-phosphate isomerase [Planktomarina sp.]MDA9100788.1 D-sedoheptulose 7-phosphate isomerase [Planktomarina sp.]
MARLFQKSLEKHLELFNRLICVERDVETACLEIVKSLDSGGKLMFCGNGGSAADSQHLAAEFVGKYTKDRVPLAAIALTTDTSALTCVGNDYSFGEIFSRQVQGLGRFGDCLVGISTSGNSENIIQAVVKANELGIKTIGMLGCDGGRLAELCEVAIVVPSAVTAHIQEAHIMIGHVICGQVETDLGLV